VTECRSGRQCIAGPPGVLSSNTDTLGPTGRTEVRTHRVTPGNIHRAATFHARVRNDSYAVRTDVEVVDRQITQGFELFVQTVLIDDRLAAVARLHNDSV